ncbi:hypothetical protein ASC78_05970 [Variovorax sp. Root318D1]|uniref:hypothetical protein n=1 Tax=Variovorax sp. Root318D1 TaxID=1736513 RepID=UPI0006FE8559|nr:hypothetical protein [Variovorax sp. Root318D1]KQU87084.1 hypothetical protein ASC78_05970 [Variovorax sp. Root318D1]
MNNTTRSIIAALIAVGGIAAATTASAQPRRGDSTYQQELSVCGRNQQDRAACIREAGAARHEAARGGLTSAPDYRRNALARCSLQPPADRADCEARVLGGSGNTTGNVDGSVMGGGVIRESVTTVVMPAPAVMPAPEPAPSRVPPPAMAPMTPMAPMQPMAPAPMPAPMTPVR